MVDAISVNSLVDSPELKQLLESIYTDPIDQVIEARVEENGDILAIARDDIKILAFKFTDTEAMVRIVNPDDIADDDSPQAQSLATANSGELLSAIINKPTAYPAFYDFD